MCTQMEGRAEKKKSPSCLRDPERGVCPYNIILVLLTIPHPAASFSFLIPRGISAPRESERERKMSQSQIKKRKQRPRCHIENGDAMCYTHFINMLILYV